MGRLRRSSEALGGARLFSMRKSEEADVLLGLRW